MVTIYDADIHLFKVNKKTPEWCRRQSVVFLIKFEKISHNVLGFQLLTLNKKIPAG